MKRIRIAQIGASETTHATHIFKSLLRQSDQFEVVAFADVDRHTHPIDPAYLTVPRKTPEEILKDDTLDAVAVECDEVLLTRYAIMAAERGLPVHMDKPGSESGADFERLIDLVEEKNLLFHMAYMYRYNPAVQYIYEAVREGRLGEIHSVEAQMNCWHPKDMRGWLSGFHGGMMFYLGCHLVDLIYRLQGMPEEVVPINLPAAEDCPESRDSGFALFRYPHGASFAKTCALEPGGFLRRQLVVTGEKGSIELKPLERSMGNGIVSTEMTENYLDAGGSSSWNEEGRRAVFGPFNRYDGMMKAFAEMVRGERENPFTPEYERQLHRLILRACGL